ncbi:hypothetical protein Tco_0615271 [Tanacetum coccineum]
MVPATAPLTGLSGEIIWPLGQVKLLVIIGDANHSTKEWMNFLIVRSSSPYNNIIGRPGIKEIQAVSSTAHEMLKFLVDGGIVTICSAILAPTECATVTVEPMKFPEKAAAQNKNFKVAIHQDFLGQEVAISGTLSARGQTELCALLKGNLDVFAWQPSDITGVEVKKLVEAGIIQEVHYHDWLSNLVMVRKHDDSWRMCLDFTDLNKSWPQDYYPLPEIDWKVESLCGNPFKCFLDAYKGYHQIQMAEHDEKKTAFHTSLGSHTETELLRDIEETFYMLRKINMKLNPKKCTFRAAEGMFLGYMISLDRIRPCQEKTEAVIQLPSPRTVKEVQSLNGKLDSLNRFLSKSAEKSLPLFKTLKNCIKKSDFQWTPEAEQAFKQLK